MLSSGVASAGSCGCSDAPCLNVMKLIKATVWGERNWKARQIRQGFLRRHTSVPVGGVSKRVR